MPDPSAKVSTARTGGSPQRPASKEKETEEMLPSSRLFSFATLNDVTRLAHVAASSYKGDDILYKDEAGGSYLGIRQAGEIRSSGQSISGRAL